MPPWSCGQRNRSTGSQNLLGLLAKRTKNGPTSSSTSSNFKASTNNRFLPPGPAADAAWHDCQVHDCTAKITHHGIDFGVDTDAGLKRVETLLKSRAKNAKPRAERNNLVAQNLRSTGAGFVYVRRAQLLAGQGMDKPHGFGASVIGVSPSITSQQKSNVAAATGVMHGGSFRTLAIEWVYGPEGQPEARNPILVIRACMRFIGDTDIPAVALEKGRAMRYSEQMDHKSRGPDHILDAIASARTAAILHLLQLWVVPASAANWFRCEVADDPASFVICMDMRCPVDREAHIHWIEERLT